MIVGLYFAAGGAQVSAQQDGVAARRPVFLQPSADYHGPDEVAALVQSWIDASPSVHSVDLGATRSGRDVPALEFGRPGESTLASRRTVVIVGAMDGRSQAGAEAVLWTAHALLSQLDHLDPTLAFLVVPWGAPDALARTHAPAVRGGRNLAPLDEDLDGFLDEDPPDDIDGDGLVLEMLLPDPDGEWCFSEDSRFLVPAVSGDTPRFTRAREGRDDDGDGRFNEDGVGGVDFDAHFPVGWRGAGADGSGGRWPLEEEVPRRLADTLIVRNVALAFVFQGSHGGLRFPEAAAQSHPDVQRRIELGFERATGRRLRARDVLTPPTGGLVDWISGSLGAVAVEVAVWGPEAVGIDGRPFVSRPRSLGGFDSDAPDLSRGVLDTGRELDGEALLWARWLDDVRGGAGYLDWHPVDLGKGATGWVGGWEPRMREDPPADLLGPALEGLPRFVLEITSALPRLEIEVIESERRGELLDVSVRVVNRGGLGTECIARTPGGAVELELEAACDASIVAGAPLVDLGRLGPGETSREVRWLVAAPDGGAVRVVARSSGTATVRREIRP